MASTDTLMDVINEILLATGQISTKTRISNTDDTSYVRDRINDALEEIYGLKPFNVDVAGTTTITPSTRLLNGPAATDLNNIYTWSFRVTTPSGDVPVAYVTEQFIIQNCPDYATVEADYPRYVYFAEGGFLAPYPMLKAGAANLTLKFIYSSQLIKLTATTATFPFENRSDELRFIKLSAQRDYEIYKNLGAPDITAQKASNLWAKMVAKYRKGKRIGFTGARLYGR